jgi:hypothetical protein
MHSKEVTSSVGRLTPVQRTPELALRAADRPQLSGRQLEMSRKHIAILLLYVLLACSACGEPEAKKAVFSSRESAFQRKLICAELGRRGQDKSRFAGLC